MNRLKPKNKKENTFLILMPYYNRSKDVLISLKSIKDQYYKNWKLAFVDDGSDEPGEDIVKSFFNKKELENVTFYNTKDTREIKNQRKIDFPNVVGAEDPHAGCFFVPYFNKAMESIEFDIALFLCDDDYLNVNYLSSLNFYYNNNPDIVYSYCNLILYESINEDKTFFSSPFNRFTCNIPIYPYYNLDSTQVSWRKKCFDEGCRFDEEYHQYFDAVWYRTLQLKYGKCQYNKLIGQYKKFQSAFFYEPKKWYITE